jgi:hypothetical protein
MNEGKNVQDLANVMMKDYAFYMRKTDGSDYNEAVIKTMWNSAAKSLQEMDFEKFRINLNPFENIEFQEARKARDSKRRILQEIPE